MSHQPFETYLLSDANLTEEQQRLLNQHMDECERCTTLFHGLREFEAAMAQSTPPIPASGFTQRWQGRLIAHQQARETRKIWLVVASLIAVAGISAITIVLFNLFQLNWAYEISQLIARVSISVAQVRQFSQFISKLTNSIPVLMPFLALFGVSFFLSIPLLIITWLGTVIKLYSPIYEKGNIP